MAAVSLRFGLTLARLLLRSRLVIARLSSDSRFGPVEKRREDARAHVE